MQADAKAQDAIVFSMRDLPLLQTGMTTTPLAHAANLWLHAKVYSGGGENYLHAHELEDHAFFVLQGVARFFFSDGGRRDARPYEGVMLPKGTLYRFEAVAGENLVMLRVGGAQAGADWTGDNVRGSPREVRRVIDEHGRPITTPDSKGKTPAEAVTILAGRRVASD